MRHEASVVSVSWIPSEAVTGMTKLPFEVGVTHYDDPPPERISGPEELEALRVARRFRFANELRAWVDVADGRIVGHGQAGGGHLGITRVSLARALGFQRTATLRAVTPCRVAVATGDALDVAALSELSGGHRREEAPPA